MDKYSRQNLAKLRVIELRTLAKKHKLIGYSQLRKDDLVRRLALHLAALGKATDVATAEAGQGGKPNALTTATPATGEPVAASGAEPSPAPDEEPAGDDPGAMRDASWYPPELPDGYGIDRITLMVRDPHWLFCYWEVSEELLAAARVRMRGPSHRILRIHVLDGAGAEVDLWDQDVNDFATSWYLETGRPGARFQIELGLSDESGNYVRLVISNTVSTPADTPSESWDEEWVGLSRDTWEHLEQTIHPFPGSMVGMQMSPKELKAMAAARIGGSELSASRPGRKSVKQ